MFSVIFLIQIWHLGIFKQKLLIVQTQIIKAKFAYNIVDILFLGWMCPWYEYIQLIKTECWYKSIS